MKRRSQMFDENGFAYGPDAWLNRKSKEHAELMSNYYNYYYSQDGQAVPVISEKQLRVVLQRAFYTGASWQKLRK